MKICTTCKQEKELDNFYYHKVHGYIASCRECEKKKARFYRLNNPEKCKAKSKKWRDNNISYQQEYHKKNAKKICQRSKQWLKDNPEKAKQTYLKNYAKNKDQYLERSRKRKALKRNAEHDNYMPWLSKVKSKKMFICYWCSEKVTTKNLHVDHIIPLSRGGQDTWDNICASCDKCNMSKGAKTPEEFITTGQLVMNF